MFLRKITGDFDTRISIVITEYTNKQACLFVYSGEIIDTCILLLIF